MNYENKKKLNKIQQTIRNEIDQKFIGYMSIV